jgi:hypothetical protein
VPIANTNSHGATASQWENRVSRYLRISSKFGWPLLLPLAAGDSYLFSALRVPLSDEQSEFDGQVLALARILVDSLNEKALDGCLTGVPDGTKGITKFELFLKSLSFAKTEELIGQLRSIYGLGCHHSGVSRRL